CGETRNVGEQVIQQNLIQCQTCETWEHVACQLGGKDAIPEPFFCNECNGSPPGFWGSQWKQTFHAKWQKSNKNGEVQARKDVKKRLRPGLTVLVQDGIFYYPARLIVLVSKAFWKAKFWRGNFPHIDAIHEPGDYLDIHVDTIVDALQNNTEDRRRIRLGRFTTTREINNLKMDMEANVMDPKTSRKYTPEVQRVLSPQLKRLQKLIFEPKNCSPSEYPTLQYQQASKSLVVPFTGGLRYGLRSEAINWMFNSIPGLKERSDFTWVTDGPLQDALLLLIADRDYTEFVGLPECPKRSGKRE
ncbi:hypothetical protein V5O48_019253, partial [Marasmius crinis-equi]